MSSLADKMIDALHGGATVQMSVRKMIMDSVDLEDICEQIAIFKQRSEDAIDIEPEDVDKKIMRRKTNNIIGDVSRICRDMTGKTIVCTQRKGPYKYEAQDPTPRAKKLATTIISPVIEVDDAVPSVDAYKAEIAELSEKLSKANERLREWDRLFNEAPLDMLEALIHEHGREEIGMGVVTVIKSFG